MASSMPRLALPLKITALAGLSFLTASPASAANQISPSRIQIDSPLTEADVASVQSLKRWPDVAINVPRSATSESFASLEKLPEIREIIVAPGNKDIASLKPLASLPRLQKLKLNTVEKAKSSPLGLSPLAHCPDLVEIEFYATPVADIEALASCTKLQDANFYMSTVDSLDFLASTPEMRKLNLYGTAHTFPSYEPVTKLTKLSELNIYMNKQATDANLSVLQKLTSLRLIRMSNSAQVTSLDFLSNCADLEELHAHSCRKLSDIKALARMPKLSLAYLSNAAITDITMLTDKPGLRFLNLAGVKIADFSSLKNARSLQQLDLSKTSFGDLALLAEMSALETLKIDQTPVSDLKPLKDLSKLMHLSFDQTAVTDLSPLSGLSALRTVSLDKTAVTDLTPLHGLAKLDRVTLSRTTPQPQIDALKAALPNLEVRFD
jgi:internalin A